MDDFFIVIVHALVLKAIAILKSSFAPEGFSCHLDKTQMGRIENGFGWLGQRYTLCTMTQSPRSLARVEEQRIEKERRQRLYEYTLGL